MTLFRCVAWNRGVKDWEYIPAKSAAEARALALQVFPTEKGWRGHKVYVSSINYTKKS